VETIMDQPTSTVLIVDDEPHVVHVIQFKLERAGLGVLVAGNGRRGFDLALEHGPDLVITDFQMPGGDGLELAKRLRDDPATADIPVIMLTARGHRAPLEELASTNVHSLLAKPFSPRELLHKVQQQLRPVTPTAASDDEPGASAA
jgi:CheY-like chemotaxis protein